MPEDQNSRRSPRVCLAALAAMETRGSLNAGDQAIGSVRDVSRTGIRLETGQPPLVGQVVQLRLAIDDVVHELLTRTTRVTRRTNSSFYDVGLDWSNCSPEQLAFLDDVLRLFEQPTT